MQLFSNFIIEKSVLSDQLPDFNIAHTHLPFFIKIFKVVDFLLTILYNITTTIDIVVMLSYNEIERKHFFEKRW